MQRLGLNPGGHETRRRCVLKTPGPESALRGHTAEPLADQRVDGAAPGHHAGLRRGLQPPVEDVAHPTSVTQPGDETKMIQDFSPGASGPRWPLSHGGASPDIRS